ncbi:hypothetical protein NPIL_535561 [Nephila pilipes]|uniref:Uncharacterized protein n=1 Tax=Nephila pilipes TaxID=299642 RepID=A0A8X6NX27_NEPPI|nr:hypothetical protein NPIL_535561 [Nephila pilipes]
MPKMCRKPHHQKLQENFANSSQVRTLQSYPINAKLVKPPTVNITEERRKLQQAKMAPQSQIPTQHITAPQNSTTNPSLVDTMSQFLNQMGTIL